MPGANIIYLRDDDSLDSQIKKAVDFLSKESMLRTSSSDKIDVLLGRCDFVSRCKFDILIYWGDNLEALLSRAEELPATSIINICDKKEEDLQSGWIESKFLEDFSIRRLRECPQCLAKLIRKNVRILEKYYEDHNILDNMFRIVPNGVSIIDPRGRIVHSNAHLTGYSLEELKNISIFSLINEHNREKVEQYMEMGINDGKGRRFQCDVKKHDGTVIPVEVSAIPICNYHGLPVKFLAVLTDISDKREVWKKGQFLTHLIETSRDGIVALDRDFKITIWNRGAQEIMGYDSDEMIGRYIRDLCWTPEEAQRQQECFLELKKNGFIKNFLVKYRTKTGQMVDTEITLTAIYDEDGGFLGASAVMRNVSPMKVSLEEAQKRNEEMEHLINVVSHDLRSPLTSIDNYLNVIFESIQDKIVEDDDVREMFQRTFANLANMDSLIKDLTHFSRAGRIGGEEMAVNLNSVVSDIVSNIQWQVEKDSFRVQVEELPTVRIDPHRIHQVFENLISNAYKFRRDGSVARAEVRVKRDGKMIRFTVKDYGIGIAREHHHRIFNLFYRTKEKHVQGSGAGLAIARKIINIYGGEIWLESKPGEGSTFHFTLPASRVVEE